MGNNCCGDDEETPGYQKPLGEALPCHINIKRKGVTENSGVKSLTKFVNKHEIEGLLYHNSNAGQFQCYLCEANQNSREGGPGKRPTKKLLTCLNMRRESFKEA